jgi:hypothetical protein
VFRADGSVDDSVGDHGVIAISGMSTGQGVSTDAGGQLYVAGTQGNVIVLTRLTSALAQDPSFGNASLATFATAASADDSTMIDVVRALPGGGVLIAVSVYHTNSEDHFILKFTT